MSDLVAKLESSDRPYRVLGLFCLYTICGVLRHPLNVIRDNHLDDNGAIDNRSTGGLAIKNFEAWLLADTQTVSNMLGVEVEQFENTED